MKSKSDAHLLRSPDPQQSGIDVIDNDSRRKSFKQIAAIIESEPEGLFRA